jgi:hypothetical protein
VGFLMRALWLSAWLSLVALAIVPSQRVAYAARIPLAVIAHASVKVTTLHVNELRAVFLRQTEQLGGQRVIPVNQPTNNPLRIDFDARVLGMTPDEVGRFWVDARIRGGGAPPRAVSNPQLLVRTVAALPGAIGYAPVSMVAGMPVRILKVSGLTQGL